MEYDTPLGTAAAYYPETNPLIPLDHTAEGSNQPASKSVIVALHRTSEDSGKADDSAEAGDGGPTETDADRAGVKRSDKSDPDPVHMS